MGSGHAAGARGVRLWWGRDSRQASRCPRARPTPWGSGGTGKMGPGCCQLGRQRATPAPNCPSLGISLQKSQGSGYRDPRDQVPPGHTCPYCCWSMCSHIHTNSTLSQTPMPLCMHVCSLLIPTCPHTCPHRAVYLYALTHMLTRSHGCRDWEFSSS